MTFFSIWKSMRFGKQDSDFSSLFFTKQSKWLLFLSMYPTSALTTIPSGWVTLWVSIWMMRSFSSLHYTEMNTEGHRFPAWGTFCQRRGKQKQRSKNPTWNSYLPFIICFLPTLYSVLFTNSLMGKLFWWSSKQVAPELPGLLLWELSQIICLFRLFSWYIQLITVVHSKVREQMGQWIRMMFKIIPQSQKFAQLILWKHTVENRISIKSSN